MKSFSVKEYRQFSTAQNYLCAFMEGALPANIDNYTIDDVLNNCLIARPYYRSTYGIGGKLCFMPHNRQDTAQAAIRWPLFSAQQQVDSALGKKVIPKVILRKDFADVTIGDSAARTTLAARAFNILQHRHQTGESTLDWLYDTSTPTIRTSTDTDGKVVFAEYDFGTDVTLNNIIYQHVAYANTYVEPTFTANQTYIQAYIAGAWVNVSAALLLQGSVGVGNSYTIPVVYSGGSTVTATRFRIKATNLAQAAAPANQICYNFVLHFFGTYVGTPRVTSDIGHVIMMPMSNNNAIAFNANNVGNTCCWNTSIQTYQDTLRDRVVGMSGYSVTGDPKQIANFDMFMPNDSKKFVQGTDLYPPFFVTDVPIVELVAL